MSCVNVLKAKGLKLTPQRRLILDFIHDGAHLTAEDIIAHVQARMPGVNKSTIYRTLELLESNECVYKSRIGDRSVYEHDEEGHHHHLVCRRCGKTVDCDEHLFQPVEKSAREKYGFKASFRHSIISGTCRECNRERKHGEPDHD